MDENKKENTEQEQAYNSLTKEQFEFLRCKARIKKLESKEELTEIDRMEIDKIKEYLWSIIFKFAMKEAHNKMSRFRLPGDAYSDVQQSLALMFFEKLDAYNPLIATPTTYFVRYFNQVVNEYLRADSQHLSQYDSANIRKVRNAIAEYQRKGVRYTAEMIANKTNLSVKVVKKTIDIANNTIWGVIDEEVYQIQSNSPTPEQAFFEKDDLDAIMETIEGTLNPQEKRLFLSRINLDGEDVIPYDQLGKMYGMTTRDMKKAINKILCKLGSSKSLQERYPRFKRKKQYTSKVNLVDNTAEEIQKDLVDLFSEQK